MIEGTQTAITENIETPLGAVKVSVTSNSSSAITVGEMPKEIENGMFIEYSEAALITVNPNSGALRIKLSCELIDASSKGTSSTGQYLDCIEWFSDKWHVTLGTEDDEILRYRYSEFEFIENSIEYHDSRIILNLEVLNVQEAMSLHVIVSSKSLPDARDCTAWFFADRPHDLVTQAISQHAKQ